jgi:hypothetical protein
LGTLRQQIAKFPRAHARQEWHGFPFGPVDRGLAPPHPPGRPLPRDALQSMVDAALLTGAERKRLLRGKFL